MNLNEKIQLIADGQFDVIDKMLNGDLMNICKELTSLRQYKAEAESQEPVARVSHNMVTGKEVIHRLPVQSLQPNAYLHEKLYARPVPAGSCAVPENVGMIPLHHGEPDITNEMKGRCIGEFSFEIEVPEVDDDMEVTGEMEDITVTVPWDLCKDIYKAMAKVAMLSAIPSNSEGEKS